MTDQADLDQDEFNKREEASAARACRVLDSAVTSIREDELGNDPITEGMCADELLNQYFRHQLIVEMVGGKVDYEQVGQNLIKQAAKFALEVAENEVE